MKLVILEPLGISEEDLLGRIKDKLGTEIEVVYYNTRVEDTESLIERSREADIVMLSNFKYDREVMAHCPQLKMICVAFTGVDHIDMTYCKERGITVCNCAGYSNVAVADLVFGMIIGLYRNIIPCNETVRHGGTKDGLVGFELEGKKFGIIGTGAIGLRTAQIAKAFGCEVYAYSRTVKPETGLKYVDLETLLKTCDIVSLHVPQTAETVGMINEEHLALMKKNAILINTARGPIVDSKALAKALKEEIIAGAGVDVFEMEPPVPEEHPLFEAPNLIVTPHIAFATKEALSKRADIAINNVKLWLEGMPQNVMN